MKKIVIKNIWLIAFLLLHYLTRESDIFLLTITFSLSIIFINLFPIDSFLLLMKKYHDKNYTYSENKIFKFGIMMAILLGVITSVTCYLTSNIVVISNLNIVSIFMSLFLISYWIINLESSYLKINNKKLGDYLLDIFEIISFIIFTIILILSYKIFNFPEYLKISFLYLSSPIAFVILNIILYLNCFKKKKIVPQKEEIKINYIKELKNKISSSANLIVYKILCTSYIYISIIILYFTLINRYNYKYITSTEIINNTYFYGIILIYLIYISIYKYYQTDLKALKENIKIKNANVNIRINNLLNSLFSTTLSVITTISIISGPICKLIFNIDVNIILGLLPLLFTIVLFRFILELNLSINKSKNNFIIILSGLLVKVVFEIPLIDTIYRMGYNLSFGSILANTIGLAISILVGIFFLYKKLKISFTSNFNNILNIIYENILLCSILLLFTLIVKVETNNFISSLLVIIFYLIIASLFFAIKKTLKKRKP